MSYKYIYDPIALIEYKDAIRWYRSGSENVAQKFVLEVANKIEMICKHPMRCRNEYKNFRETVLKKYPYCIVYFIDEEIKTIVIISIYHQRRNPNRKYDK